MTPRVAVIGLGHWGPNLARNFAALGSLGAICDADGGRLAEIAARHPEARALSDFDAVLEDPSIDAVAIATPAATHGALVRRALEAGKHTLVEKPLCLNLDEGRDLAELAKARGRVLMIGHLLLYHRAYLAMRKRIEDGAIGPIRYLYCNRLSLGKIRREENALWSFAPHDISMILGLVGGLPERIVTNGGSYLRPDVADTTLSHLTFEGGIQAHVFVSWLHPYKEHRMVVVGSDGMIVFDDSLTGPGKLQRFGHGVEWQGDIPHVTRADAEPLHYEAREPLAEECEHFLDCVRHGITPRSNAEEALRVLAVLDACQRSLLSGGPTTIEIDSKK